MVTFDDLGAAIAARCAASAAFAAAVTGGLFFDRDDTDAATPYGVCGIERAGDPEFDSGGGYTQAFTVRMVVYAELAKKDANVIQLAMAAAMNTNPTGWAALRAGRVMHCLPRGYDGKYAPKLKDGKGVFVSGGQWSLLVEGNLEA